MPPPAAAPAATDDLSAVLGDEIAELRKEIEALVQGGLSEEEAQGLLQWVQGVEGKIKAVAAVLADPTPASVAAYLRFVASGVESTRSRRFATRSLRALRSVLCRM